MTAVVLLMLSMPPRPAAELAAWLVGRPDIAGDLVRICERESRCEAVGVHPVDAHLDGWGGQVRLGHLDPGCQPWAPRTWTTRGPWGLSAASHWDYLPACYPAAVLDVPLVSALVAARKFVDRCEGKSRARWCPRGRS